MKFIDVHTGMKGIDQKGLVAAARAGSEAPGRRSA